MAVGARLLAGLIVLVSLALCSLPLHAQSHENSPMWGKPAFDDPDDMEDPEEWQEKLANLPPYPQDQDLVALNLPSRSGFAVFIDGKNMLVGEDAVVRYTVVLRSARGVDNVIAEGIRCATREYREYATGTGSEFEPMTDRPWRFISGSGGPFAYRHALSEDWACKYDRNPYPTETILKRIAGESDPLNDFLVDDY